jgi:adenylate cyclase
MSGFSEVSLLIVVTDFTRYTAQVDGLADLDAASVMSDYYALADAAIRAAGGRVVKFIGDAMLAVFPPERVDSGVVGLLELKEAADRFMADRDWDCRLQAKVHYGTVAQGLFRAAGEGGFDILGKAVNVAFRLEAAGGVTLSVEAFRQLGPEVRARFKKHTPPITYIRLEDAHRPRWARRP